ncbi:unnamed protein product [Ambrosiozyma monospora]|uniref:Unnamed protein product n=1 Tax=Ambrosiozyma monospora TaxID=43982 RepID=A0ACB5SXL9_AMBMO|nr:unnamed protein product [Ambrosiozyma monospora]
MKNSSASNTDPSNNTMSSNPNIANRDPHNHISTNGNDNKDNDNDSNVEDTSNVDSSAIYDNSDLDDSIVDDKKPKLENSSGKTEDTNGMDSKKLKKLQKQERLKKRLFTQLHMTDNDNFEFEEEKLLHSSRSFRDRQRIDYNENKRPPRSTATAPAHTVTTRSTDHHANAKSTSDPPTSTDSNTADKQHVKPSDPASKSVVLRKWLES